jgi:hypothetical protein
MTIGYTALGSMGAKGCAVYVVHAPAKESFERHHNAVCAEPSIVQISAPWLYFDALHSPHDAGGNVPKG